MCIIIYKQPGVKMPDNDILKNCWENNDDGAGLMYQLSEEEDKTLIHIKKGFMKLQQLQTYLNRMDFQEADTVLLHFRTSTSGKQDKHCCHPFPISNLKKDLKATQITTGQALMHNGILGSGAKDLSDTMLFVKEILAPVKNFLNDKGVIDLVEYAARKDRLAIFSYGDIILTGDWKEHLELYFSNEQYKTKIYPRYDTARHRTNHHDVYYHHNGKYGKWVNTSGNNYEFLSTAEIREFENKQNEKPVTDIGKSRLKKLLKLHTGECPHCQAQVDYTKFELDGIGVECKKCGLFISDFFTKATVVTFKTQLTLIEFNKIADSTLNDFEKVSQRMKIHEKIELRRNNVILRVKNKEKDNSEKKVFDLMKTKAEERYQKRLEELQEMQDHENGIVRYDKITWQRTFNVMSVNFTYSLRFYKDFFDNSPCNSLTGIKIADLYKYLNKADATKIGSATYTRGTIHNTHVKTDTEESSVICL